MQVVRAQNQNLALYEGVVANYAISGKTVGAKGICMSYYRLPPGGRSGIHFHRDCETATFVSRGHALLYSGDGLGEMTALAPGDLIYIPANEVHVIANPAATEWLEYVACRSALDDRLVEVTQGASPQ